MEVISGSIKEVAVKKKKKKKFFDIMFIIIKIIVKQYGILNYGILIGCLSCAKSMIIQHQGMFNKSIITIKIIASIPPIYFSLSSVFLIYMGRK